MAGKKKDPSKDYNENWGGSRRNAGRPRKGEVVKFRELLDQAADTEFVVEKLMERIESGDIRAIEMYMKYRVGVPKQEIDLNHGGSTEFKIQNIINKVEFDDDAESEI